MEAYNFRHILDKHERNVFDNNVTCAHGVLKIDYQPFDLSKKKEDGEEWRARDDGKEGGELLKKKGVHSRRFRHLGG